jgi:hypothetical protein
MRALTVAAALALTATSVTAVANPLAPPDAAAAPPPGFLAMPDTRLARIGKYDYGSVFYTAVSIPGQLIGAGLWIYGSARPGTRLVPMENGAMVSFAPIGSGGVALSGRF